MDIMTLPACLSFQCSDLREVAQTMYPYSKPPPHGVLNVHVTKFSVLVTGNTSTISFSKSFIHLTELFWYKVSDSYLLRRTVRNGHSKITKNLAGIS
jgi:hypothetical protein